MDLFSDRERQVIPFLVALLFVGRNRIVDDGLDSILGEVFLQFVAMLSPDAEDVEHVRVPVSHLRQYYLGILDVLDVVLSDLPAFQVVLVKISELHIEHRSLYLVQPAVAALVFENVLSGRAVVGE